MQTCEAVLETLQEETFVETVALSIARVLAGGAGFLVGACMCVIRAGPGRSKSSFHLLTTFRHSGAWPPGGCNRSAQAAFPVYQAFHGLKTERGLGCRCVFAVHLHDANMKT